MKVTFSALTNAINLGRLNASIKHKIREPGFNFDQGEIDETWMKDQEGRAVFVKNEPNWATTLIDLSDLIEWLRSRGLNSGFFFPKGKDAPGYLDPENPRFAPKLAASINAWLAVTDPGAKSPKQALDKWLRENAAKFGLTDDEGNPINTAIEECSKVANWQPGGGAAKTPGG